MYKKLKYQSPKCHGGPNRSIFRLVISPNRFYSEKSFLRKVLIFRRVISHTQVLWKFISPFLVWKVFLFSFLFVCLFVCFVCFFLFVCFILFLFVCFILVLFCFVFCFVFVFCLFRKTISPNSFYSERSFLRKFLFPSNFQRLYNCAGVGEMTFWNKKSLREMTFRNKNRSEKIKVGISTSIVRLVGVVGVLVPSGV